MMIFPAIDLRGGQCVRLRQGDYTQETVFGADPAAMAQRWVSQGARWLHLVDLDGARAGRPCNGDSIRRIVTTAGVPCQLGGGLRTEADIDAALGWDVARVILGTRALGDPTWLERMTERYPNRIILGLDARDGHVATDGWLHHSERRTLDVVRQCQGWPLAALVYTDISRDGMLAGPNFDALAELAAQTSLPVIASGGVSTIEDVQRLAHLKLAGCIIGRALYEGKLQLAEAIHLVGSP
jgi:phosphoribosylformimino-5-aminoimidazole carboxamide ribotide isomerase